MATCRRARTSPVQRVLAVATATGQKVVQLDAAMVPGLA